MMRIHMSTLHPVAVALTVFIAISVFATGCASGRPARMPRVILTNDESVAYTTYCATERATAGDLQEMVKFLARSGVDTLTQCVHTRWQAYYDSKVVEVAGDQRHAGEQPARRAEDWAYLSAMRRLIDVGDDPPKVLADACHRNGMRFVPSLRLNDSTELDEKDGRYGRFRRDHPQWRIPDSHAMDFGVSEVRQHIVDVVSELAARYDIDGIELDFMRHPRFFRADQVRDQTAAMTDLVRRVRSVLDDTAAGRAQRLLLIVRVPMKIGDGGFTTDDPNHVDLECLGTGLDVPTWVSEGLVDIVCPMSFSSTDWDRMIAAMARWRSLTEGTGCGVYPTIQRSPKSGYAPPWAMADSYRGAAYSFYLHGADGIALYNLGAHSLYNPWTRALGHMVGMTDGPYASWKVVADMDSPSRLTAGPRRYPCYLGPMVPVEKGQRKTLEFYMPEDPQDATLRPHLRFFAPNFTLGHRIEVDINGVTVESEALIYERNAEGGLRNKTGGNPRMPYGHQVIFRLDGTAARKGMNTLGVKLIDGNPQIPRLVSYRGLPATHGGIAICLIEALVAYDDLPRYARPGSHLRRSATESPTVSLAEPTSKPRVIIMTDSSTAYAGYCPSERATALDLHYMIETFRRGGVDTYGHCVHSRWQAVYDSKVVEIVGDVTPEIVQPPHYSHYWVRYAIVRNLIEDGIDVPQVIAETCHQRGMRALGYFRMNDVHGVHKHEPIFGSFRSGHPEWMFAIKSMDYAVPQVREHILSVVRELVDRYDLDGIDFDFMRAPRYFRDGQVEAGTPLMTDMIRQVRRILDDAGDVKGGRRILCVRVPMTVSDSTGAGLDVPTWVAEDLIDMVCPAHFYYSRWSQVMQALPEWKKITRGTRCGLYPTIHYGGAPGYNHPWLTTESYRGMAHGYYQRGADGIALYNIWNMNNEPAWAAAADMGDPKRLAKKARRYHCYLGGLSLINQGDQKTFDILLPDDPQDRRQRARLRFYAVNLTLDHRIEVTLNGEVIDPQSLALRRKSPGEFVGASAFGYGHFVTFPLAGTAAKRGINKLDVRLVAINPQLPKLAASHGVKESAGGIAVGVIEARYGYKKDPDRGRPGAWPQP